MSYYRDSHRANRSRRDRYGRYDDYQFRDCLPRARSKIMGVCSGLANQFGWDVTGVRVAAVLGLIFFTAPTFLVYIIAGALFY